MSSTTTPQGVVCDANSEAQEYWIAGRAAV